MDARDPMLQEMAAELESNRDALQLGLAWEEAWAAMPEGYVLQLGATKLPDGQVMATAAIFSMPTHEGGTAEPILGNYALSPVEAIHGLVRGAADGPADEPPT